MSTIISNMAPTSEETLIPPKETNLGVAQELFYPKIHPLSPKRDQHQTSPCNIIPLENRVVMGIEHMIREDEYI